GQNISVRRVNDEPITVKINGKALTKDHYQFNNGVVVITEPGTGRKHEIAMPQGNSLSGGGAGGANPFVGRIEIVEPMAPLPEGAIAGGRWSQIQDRVAPSVEGQPKVMLGVVMAEPDSVILEHLGLDAEKAVLLERVIDGLPAAKAGLEAKDIIIGFGEHAEPRSADEIRKVLAKAEPGSKVRVKVIRKGEPVMVDLKFEAFNPQALGRAVAPQTVGGVMEFAPQGGGQGLAAMERDHHDQMAVAEKALHEAAEMLARMEHDASAKTADAHRQASEAIKKAIEAMKQGDVAGLEIEEMRQMQQEAVERLRRELGANRGGGGQRFWADGGEGGTGFALTFPGGDDEGDQWGERLEQLERRLNELERNVERAVERLETRTEAMMERLINRLEQQVERMERDRK
ncbi:MAG: PDZ domain-containing protein, partial [Phycisphaerales bacterium JB064]